MKGLKIVGLALCSCLLITGCGEEENDVFSEKEQLEQYLINEGYTYSEDDNYELIINKINDDDGTPYNWNIIYVNTEKMIIQQLTALKPVGINTNANYDFKTDIADGSYSYFSTDGELTEIVNFTYDFNNGLLNCNRDDCTIYQTKANDIKSMLINMIDASKNE